MAHIDLWSESENGDVLEQFDGAGFPGEVLRSVPTDAACLRFIDPYGDAVFNHLQVPVLIAELEAMTANETNADLRARLASVVAFLAASVEVHRYVRFAGD